MKDKVIKFIAALLLTGIIMLHVWAEYIDNWIHKK